MNATTHPVYAPLGSVSSGTMRAEDLIPAFCDALDDLKDELITSCPTDFQGTEDTKQRIAALDAFLAEIEQHQQTDDYYESETADYDLEELFDALQEFAPPYCYFGALVGDGADYGFWTCWDWIEDDARYGDLLKVGDTSEIPADFSGEVIHVNDHGNATLYVAHEGELTEVWAVA